MLQICVPEISELKQYFVNPWKPDVNIPELLWKFHFGDDWSMSGGGKPIPSENIEGDFVAQMLQICVPKISQLKQSFANPWKPDVNIPELLWKFHFGGHRARSLALRPKTSTSIRLISRLWTLLEQLSVVGAFRAIGCPNTPQIPSSSTSGVTGELLNWFLVTRNEERTVYGVKTTF